MNIYIITYPGGGCGNFINYFINRHASFPNPICIGKLVDGNGSHHGIHTAPFVSDSSNHFDGDMIITDYVYIHDNHKHILYELCNNDLYSQGAYKKMQKTLLHNHHYYDNYCGSVPYWNSSYHEQRVHATQNKRRQSHLSITFLNQSFDSVAFRPSPMHTPNFFELFPDYIIKSSNDNYKHITVSIDDMFNRITTKHLKDLSHNIEKMRDAIDVPLHVINLVNLLDCNLNEYNNLLGFIEQPPLDNWKELITDYCSVINY